MAQAYVESTGTKLNVFFLGYVVNPLSPNNKYYCGGCIDSALGRPLSYEEEHLHISTGEQPLEQFTTDIQRDQTNFCFACATPLIKIIETDEQCQRRYRPTSLKFLKRFQTNQHYGPRGGGFSRSTKH